MTRASHLRAVETVGPVIHDPLRRKEGFCGPAALSAVSGVFAEEIGARICAVRDVPVRPVGGVSYSELEATARGLGVVLLPAWGSFPSWSSALAVHSIVGSVSAQRHVLWCRCRACGNADVPRSVGQWVKRAPRGFVWLVAMGSHYIVVHADGVRFTDNANPTGRRLAHEPGGYLAGRLRKVWAVYRAVQP